MTLVYRTTRRVEFRDTDAAGIAHFSVFFQFMEQAEHALLRHVGLSVFMDDGEGTVSWPRASANCDFDGSVRFEDVLDIDVSIERIGRKSVTYRFAFLSEGRSIARGALTTVYCRVEPGQALRSLAIPESVSKPLRPYLVEAS